MPRPRGMSVAEKSKNFKATVLRLFSSLDKWKKALIISMILALSSAVLSTIAPNKLSDLTNVVSDGIKPNTRNIELLSNSMKDSSQNGFLEPIKIDGVIISIEDQMSFIDIMKDVNKDNMLIKYETFPSSIKEIVEPHMDVANLKKRAIVLAIIYILGSVFNYVQGIIMAIVANRFARKLRNDISYKINRLPLKYFDSHETGDILSRVTNDVDTIGMNVSHSLSMLVTNVTLFFGSIIMMFVTNWIMAITAICSSILGFGFSFVLLKHSQKYFIERQEELGSLNGHIEEIYSGHNVVKAYNGEKEALDKFDNINEKLYTCNRKSQFLSGIMQPIMGFIGNFGYVAVCVVGALLVMNNHTTFGTIVAFMIYVRLFTNPLSQIAQAMASLQSTAAAGERVFEFMDEEELREEKLGEKRLNVKDAKGNIEFKHVTFGYDDSKTVIKDFSAEIKSGQKIAIVGPTGAGKTTMVNLLMKFYDINSGDIIIDGTSIKDLTRENVHDLFIMVLQDTWLFDGTIKENIKYNDENVTDEDIWNACKTVGIDHFIKTLPGGMNSLIDDNNIISSGQKQLITIARGMIKNSPFLILDEATSNVDTRTEELVQKAMDKLTEGKTSFIIAHRLSTIKNADLILVMNEGNIVEQGTHEELLNKNGFYANLYNSQFEQLS